MAENGIQELRDRMEEKSRQKKELISSLRQKNVRITELEKGLALAMPKDVKPGASPGRIKEKIDKLEFQIATSAYTSVQEKDLVRQVQVLKKELAGATKESAQWDGARKIRDELRKCRDERRALRDSLDAISKELDLIYGNIIAQGTKNAEDRKMREEKKEEYEAREKKRGEKRKQMEEQKKELAPYLKEIDPFVSMEEIAEVKKKNNGE